MERQKTIFVVDDNEGLRRAYARFFSSDGYNVICANDGKEALDKLNIMAERRELPDCMIIDDLMPNVRGITVLGVMYDLGLLSKIKTALCTATGDDSWKREFEKYGVGYFDKPFNNDEVLAYFNK